METFWPLSALAASAFTSATLLPGTSEAALLLFVRQYPDAATAAWLAASAANTAGSLTSYAAGRFLPPHRISPRAGNALKRWGSPLLLLSWVPVAGDALPLAAGWLRLNPWLCSLMLLAGKSLRYALLLWGWQAAGL